MGGCDEADHSPLTRSRQRHTRFELSAADGSRDIIIPDCEGGLAVDGSAQSGDCAITVNP